MIEFTEQQRQLLESDFAAEVIVMGQPDPADSPGGVQARQRVALPRLRHMVDRRSGDGLGRLRGADGGRGSAG